MKTPIRLVTILMALVFLITGCTDMPEEAKLETINIAFQQWVGYGPLYLADEKGFFKDEGINLDFIDESLDSARRDAFKQGMLDCEAGTIDLLVSKRAQNTPIVAVLEIDISFGSDGIVVTKDINKVEDLIGKKVALARDDVGETFLSYLLNKEGISFDDVIIVSKRPDEVTQTFLNGEADAVVTWEPHLSKALQRPDSHILITSKDEPGIIIDTLNVREDLVKNNPELVKKLMRGWFKAVKYYKEHPVEASGIIAKHYGITPEEYRKEVEGLKWFSYEEQITVDEEEEWVNAFNFIAELKFANKRITKKPDSGKAINRTLLRELYAPFGVTQGYPER